MLGVTTLDKAKQKKRPFFAILEIFTLISSKRRNIMHNAKLYYLLNTHTQPCILALEKNFSPGPIANFDYTLEVVRCHRGRVLPK